MPCHRLDPPGLDNVICINTVGFLNLTKVFFPVRTEGQRNELDNNVKESGLYGCCQMKLVQEALVCGLLRKPRDSPIAIQFHEDSTIPKVSYCSDRMLACVLTVLQGLVEPALESGCGVEERDLTCDGVGFEVY